MNEIFTAIAMPRIKQPRRLGALALLSVFVLAACPSHEGEGAGDPATQLERSKSGGGSSSPTDSEPAKTNLPAAEELLARHVEAAGGADKIAAIETIYAEMTTDTGEQKLVGTGKMWWKKGGKFYVEVDMPGIGPSRMGYDGTTMWMDDPVYHLRKLEGVEAADAIQSEASMFPAYDWQTYYSAAKTLGSVELEGRKYWEVELTSKQGSDLVLGFDAETGMLHHYRGKQTVPGGEMPYDAKVLEYREVGGYEFAVKHVNSVAGLIELTEVTTKLEINVPIDDSKFGYPSDKEVVPADPSLQPPVTPEPDPGP